MRTCAAILAFTLAIALQPSRAAADDGELSAIHEAVVPPRARTHWRWQRFHPLEAITLFVAEASGIAIDFADFDVGTRWRGPLPLDEDLRELFRLRSRADRELVQQMSDVSFFVFLAWPIAIDAILLAGVVHGDGDAMVQLALIDAEVLAISHLVAAITTRLAGRARPSAIECATDPESSAGCTDDGVGPHTSFVSGHAVMVFTSAGLVCDHHLRNPWLTGSVEGAAITCTAALGLATLTSAFRVMSDLHWSSDVVLGAGIGALLGVALPELLHYLHPTLRPEERTFAPTFTVLPRYDGERGGLEVMGIF